MRAAAVAAVSDPATSATDLAAIARDWPDLRPDVAGHPAAYPALCEWIEAQAGGRGAVAGAGVREPEVGASSWAGDVQWAAAADPAGASGATSAKSELSARPAAQKRQWKWKRLLAGGIALLLVAAFAGGIAVGWTVASENQARQVGTVPEIVEVAVPVFDGSDDAVMPDVRGLNEDTAMEVIADSGIPIGAVSVESRPAAGSPGMVIEQSPAFGTRAPDGVELTISTEAVVPVIEGRPAGEVIADLQVLGAEVETSRVYAAGIPAGQAVAIVPASGDVLPARVTIEIAEPSAAIFLATVRAVEGSCSTGSRTVNGVVYEESLSCRAGEDPVDVAWAVSRVVDAVEGVVGVSDDANPADRVRVEVLADGARVALVEAAYGAPAELRATVTGALRVTVRSTLLSATSTRPSGAVILGDVRLVGGAEAMSVLEGGQ